MLIEQAFFAVPEFLVGAGFASYDAEGTIVMAYAMAVLQELNGRNVNNPIAQIRGEVGYPTTNRSSDIHINYDTVGILSASFTAYGVKPDNWLEAKFFRLNATGAPTVDKLVGAYALLRDLIRLAVFPPESQGTAGQSGASRYLLHVYQDVPSRHIASTRYANATTGALKRERSWLKLLWKPGRRELRDFDLPNEPAKFDNDVGIGIRALLLEFDVQNLAIEPSSATGFHMYLTRLDRCRVELGADWIEVNGVQFAESSLGAHARLITALDAALIK